MELSQLRYFVAVAETENISRAASVLRIAQPAVSRQIRNLELELGHPLFHRSERGVTLTHAGRDYLESIRAALRQIDEASERVRIGCSEPRILRIGIVQLAQWYPRITELINGFRRRHPDITVEGLQMPSSEQPSALMRGDIDVAIGVPITLLPDELARVHLFTLNRGVVLSTDHPLASKPELSIRDIQHYPLITTSRRSWISDVSRFFEASRSEGFMPEFSETFENLSMLLSRLRDRHSIAVLPEPGPDAPMEGLEFRRVPSLDLELLLHVYWRASSPSLELQAFVDLLRADVSGNAPTGGSDPDLPFAGVAQSMRSG